jgi:MFS superfamily sulfate permease-like transporter
MQAVLGGVPVELNYGLITLAPLGAAYGSLGIMLAFMGCILAGLVGPLLGGARGVINGSRPGIAIILAHLIETLLRQPELPLGAPGTVSTVILLLLSCCALAGLMQMVIGLVGLGRAIRYLPYPVLSGLMCGIALLMLLSALKPLLGLDRHAAWAALDWAALDWADMRWLALVVAAASLYLSFAPPRLLRRIPVPILALAGGTALYYVLGRLTGPEWLGPTLPALHVQWPGQWLLQRESLLPDFRQWLGHLPTLLPFAATIALLTSLEAMLCAVNADQLLHDRHDSRQELLAQGGANLAAAVFGGTTTAGTAARLLANVRGGGRTPAASLFYALGMAAVVLLGLPLLSRVPETVTAVLLVAIAVGMVDDWLRRLLRQLLGSLGRPLTPAERALRRQWLAQGGLAAGVALTAVFLGLLWAVGVGVLAAMVLFVRNNSRPVVGRISSGSQRHSLRVRSAADMHWLETFGRQIVLMELQGSLFFGTADRMQQAVEQTAARWVILDFGGIKEVDATGVRSLQQLATRLERQGCHLLLARVAPESAVGRSLRGFGLALSVPQFHWFADADSALEHCENLLLDERGGAASHDAPVSLDDCLLARGLSAAELRLLESCMACHTLAQGSEVFAQGDAGDALYLVSRGTVSIRLPGQGSHSHRIAAFGPGVIFGEMSLLEGKPRSATAVADEDVELWSLSRDRLDWLQENHPGVAARLVRNLSLDLADRLRLTTAALGEAQAAL